MKTDTRIRIISVVIISCALIFVGKLYFLQIIQNEEFKAMGDRQYSKPSGGLFTRGGVFFKSKDGELISAATVKSGFIVAINPREIKNVDEAYEKISKHISIEKEDFMTRANSGGVYREVAKKLGDEAQNIRAENIPGVSIIKDQWRYYPGGRSASHILGFLAYKEDEIAGRYGLERSYEKNLRHDESNLYANFFVEIFSSIKKGLSDDSAFEGDIVTSIEPTVQSEFEKIIEKIHGKYQSEETAGIIMDPKTGAIYAMASYPNFDVNNFQKEESSAVFTNPLVEKVRELGSIMKPITMASGIDAGVITSKSSYFDRGFVTYNTETIYNFDKEGRGQVDMQVVLNKSLNTGVAYVVGKLGTNKFAEYMNKFGFNQKTNIDLPNESQNLTDNLKSPREVEFVTASFGQGIAVTPITMIRALGALANKGEIVEPRLVEKINYKSGIKKNIDTKIIGRAIKPESADEITKMLVEVVDTALLNGKFKDSHYSVAAKTGTAQIPSPSGGYYENRFLHSFFGYFPAYNPKFIVLLYSLDPKTNLFGADTLAPGFFDLKKFLVSYYNISPDR